MSSTWTHKPIFHGYAVLRVVTDDIRGDTAPVGVVAWDTERNWFGTRVIEKAEKVRGVPAWARQFVEITVAQLSRWAETSSVPYEPDYSPPHTDRFWRGVSDILSTAVRLDAPRAMDPMEQPDTDLESLFEAVVQPMQSKAHRQERIDGALSRALGELANEIPVRTEVSAFGHARETIRRGAVTPKGVLLIDGVNLATSRAREDADALVSRFMRIREAYAERPVEMIIGYTASPGGLNGETHMRDWIRKTLTEEVFDLTSEGTRFQRATREAWGRLDADPQGSLL